MRAVLVLILCLTASFASATSYRRPERPATPEEQVELARYDQEVIARNRRLKIRISADAELEQMLEFLRDHDESDESSDLSLKSQARYHVAQRDELAALFLATAEFDHLFDDDIEPIAADVKAQQQQFYQLIARWKPTGSTLWKILDALTQANPIEQKRLLAMALEKPLHSPVTARARALVLRYFELKLLEPAPELRVALTVYRPNSIWIQDAVLIMGFIDFEGIVATSLLETLCDSENPSPESLTLMQCQSVFQQTPLLHLISGSELSIDNFKEPTRSAFVADQQLVEQAQAAVEKCADNPPFAITMLRATSSPDWRSYLRALLTTAQKCPANTE